ncbi:MAG: competence/damage-inducible protein A [Clostridiales Family XIII bacterium]|jgi:nicotinamide-nucleotide amidase|nr:competence/damage-inducible protein A [Clostridiales Family XIII bacterium]
MPNASIVAVGTELLFGQTVNTNAAYVSEQLQLLGVSVLYHFTVGDNPARMKRTLALAFAESDIVVTTGGLGPTQDDITKEMIAEHMGAPLVYDEEAKARLDAIMRDIGRANYTENNMKQAWLPEGCTVFYNNAGTAPGFALERGGKTAIALPGPPREMKKMMRESVIPYLSQKSDSVIYSKMLRFYGIGESALETALLPIIDGQTDPTVAPYAKEGECAVRVTSMRRTEAEARAAVEATVARARELAGAYLYSEDDEEYHEVVVRLLAEKGLRLAAAESCTGGLFAGAITAVAGSSAVFDRGFVTYSNASKTALLGVPADVIERYGAVSEPCCRAMALGALARSDADIAVAVTGIAGPGGSDCGKPVGTGFYGIARRGARGDGDGEGASDARAEVHEKYFRDRGRRVNRQAAVLELCDMVRKAIEGGGR